MVPTRYERERKGEGRARRFRLRSLWPLLTLGSATALWIVSLVRVEPESVGKFGLISALPVTFFVAVGITALGAAIALWRGARLSIVLAHAALFILIVHASPAIVYDTLRYAWAWKHVGVVELMQRTHRLTPSTPVLPIYQSWPGFFAAATTLTESSGLRSALSFAAWSPPVFQLLNMFGLVFVFRALTDDRRRIGLAVWLFVIANWVGQDYFSPQAFAFFLYLVAIGIVLRWFRRPESQRPWARSRPSALGFEPDVARPVSPGPERRAVALVLLVVMAGIASSHPLTPFVLTMALLALLFLRVLTVRWPAFVMAGMTVVWMLTGAHEYFFTEGVTIFSQFGQLGSNVNSNMADIGRLSDAQQFVADMGRFVVVAVAVLAVVGFLRRSAAGHWELEAAVLCAVPATILAGGSYGGEAVFRVFLFALPFAAYLAAGAFYATARRATWRSATVVFLLSALLITGFGFGYYGKEQWFIFTPSEVRAAETVFSTAPPNSLLIDGTQTFPNAFEHQENFTYVNIADEPKASLDSVLKDPVGVLYTWMADTQYAQAYLVFTRSQREESDNTGLLPRHELERIEAQLVASDRFDVLYRDRDAVVLTVPRTEPAVTTP
jgi:hypothetical protein